MDFFLWVYMQSLVYKSPVETEPDLVARIAVAAGTIQEMPGISQRVQHNIARQCRTCKAWCSRLQWRHHVILWQELQ
jgi:hypothetical protein